jgi:hypothetical protein
MRCAAEPGGVRFKAPGGDATHGTSWGRVFAVHKPKECLFREEVKPMAINVYVNDWLLERRQRVMYLIVNWDVKELGRAVRVAPDAKFNTMVADYIRGYVEKGVMPPDDIAPAILNMADDYMADRDVAIRAGDYITIQNHLREQAGKRK